MISGSNSGIGGGGEGSEGSGGEDVLTDLNSDTLDSEGKEEYEEDEEMADPKLEWMTQGPLALPTILHKMSKRAEIVNIKFNLGTSMKAKYHLDNFYLRLQTLKVRYVDVACRLFPCTLDNGVTAWYHNLPPNSIQNWGSFKHMFLQKFVDDKTPAMLLK